MTEAQFKKTYFLSQFHFVKDRIAMRVKWLNQSGQIQLFVTQDEFWEWAQSKDRHIAGAWPESPEGAPGIEDNELSREEYMESFAKNDAVEYLCEYEEIWIK